MTLLGTPASVRTELAVAERFPGYVVRVGEYNRRPIAGTSTWSQHSWANADDFHLSVGRPANAQEKARGDEIAAWLRANQAALGIRTILWWVKDHFDHIHTDYWPKGTGTPPLTLTGVGSFIYPDGRRVSSQIQLVPAHSVGLTTDEEDVQALRLIVAEAGNKGWLPTAKDVNYWLKLAETPRSVEWKRDFEPAWSQWKLDEGRAIAAAKAGMTPAQAQKLTGLEAAVTKIRNALRSV